MYLHIFIIIICFVKKRKNKSTKLLKYFLGNNQCWKVLDFRLGSRSGFMVCRLEVQHCTGTVSATRPSNQPYKTIKLEVKLRVLIINLDTTQN